MFQIYTVPNCTWCDKAKKLAEELGYEIEEFDFYAPSMWEWEELTGIPKGTILWRYRKGWTSDRLFSVGQCRKSN